MVRYILDWTKETLDNIQTETVTVTSVAKAVGCGFIEEYVNYAVVMGTIGIVSLAVIAALGKEITITDKGA